MIEMLNPFLCRPVIAGLISVALVSTFISESTAEEWLFPNSGFEAGTLDGWTAEGDAFTLQPTRGDNPNARGRESSFHEGDFWIGTYERHDGKSGKPGAVRGDVAVGTLTSPVFTITKPWISFKVGGGYHPGQCGVGLLVDGELIELSSGVDSESMVSVSSDVTEHVGKPARIVIYDNVTGGWGHINADHFTATDQAVIDERSKFAFVDGISAEAYPGTAYDQQRRPQFHFTSKQNWLNDPNGMIFDGEKYHLFFQHNPKGTNWGNMTWGHATSPDMLRWAQVEHALLPYSIDGRPGTIYSGTAVVDHNNSLGKQVGDTKTLVAFYTFATKPKFYQAMAYSNDLGDTWTYWNEGRAVVENQGFDHGERDPKVFWHAPSNQWVMVLWVQQNPGRVRFFTSKNLTDWEFASDLLRDWAFECMDVVFLPVDGDKDNVKCLIYDASFDYEIGEFDGEKFVSETGPLVTGGGNFYAAQTFYNQPQHRAIQMGWMRGGPNAADVYDVPFNQQMSFPSELKIRSTPDGLRVACSPIREIDSLVKDTYEVGEVELVEGANLLSNVDPLDLVDMTIEFEPGTAKQVVFDLPSVRVTYDSETASATYGGREKDGNRVKHELMPDLKSRDGMVRLRFLVDRMTLEAYRLDGADFRAVYTLPNPVSESQSIHSVGGTANIKSLTIRRLGSIWE